MAMLRSGSTSSRQRDEVAAVHGAHTICERGCSERTDSSSISWASSSSLRAAETALEEWLGLAFCGTAAGAVDAALLTLGTAFSPSATCNLSVRGSAAGHWCRWSSSHCGRIFA